MNPFSPPKQPNYRGKEKRCMPLDAASMPVNNATVLRRLTLHVEMQDNGNFGGWCDELEEIIVEAETVSEAIESLLLAYKLVMDWRQLRTRK